MIYFTADQHFGHHNIIKYENRPFKDTKEMDETMIRRWNEVVHENDTVYILGDLTFSKKEADVAALMSQLKGKKVLIKGNHDYFASKVWVEKYFEQVTDYLEINCNGMKFCLMHYPMATWNRKHHGAIHLHGHIHSNKLPFDIGGRILNVGVDLFDYRPVSINKVIELTADMAFSFEDNEKGKADVDETYLGYEKKEDQKNAMIKIENIVEALELGSDELKYFIDVANNKIVVVTEEAFGYAEEEKDLMELPEWQRESVELADKIMYSSGKEFIRLPGKHEINEYRMMEHFIMTLDLGPIRDDLWYAIEGRGAFRRFKDKVYFHGLDQMWYKYRDEAYKTFAIEWCESNKIAFEE